MMKNGVAMIANAVENGSLACRCGEDDDDKEILCSFNFKIENEAGEAIWKRGIGVCIVQQHLKYRYPPKSQISWFHQNIYSTLRILHRYLHLDFTLS